jgi:hypothetical protein
MTPKRAASISLLLASLIAPISSLAQSGGKQPGGGASGSALPTSNLQGPTFAQADWPEKLALPPIINRAVVCYKLVYGHSSTQPFILVPVRPTPGTNSDPSHAWNTQPEDWQRFYRWRTLNTSDAPIDPQEEAFYKDPKNAGTPWTPCTVLDMHALTMNQALVIGIDTTDVDVSRLPQLNFNITFAAGSPINTTPIRPSFGTSPSTSGGVSRLSAPLLTEQAKLVADQTAARDELKGLLATASSSRMADDLQRIAARIATLQERTARLRQLENWATPVNERRQYFLTWPNLLSGDSIPTVSVNAIYTPPIPGEMRDRRTFYPVGSIVTPRPRNGHYYVALHEGLSSEETNLAFPVSTPQAIADGALAWIDTGSASSGSPAATAKPPGVWLPRHPYAQGETILDPYNGHVYASLTLAPDARDNLPAPTSGDSTSEPFSLPTWLPTQVREPSPSTLQWTWDGSPPNTTCSLRPPWQPNNPYVSGNEVRTNFGRCFKASATAASGATDPFGPNNAPQQTAKAPDEVRDGGVIWKRAAPGTTCSDKWGPGNHYRPHQTVGPYNTNVCYEATTEGDSGSLPVQAYFPATEVGTLHDGKTLLWQDVGTLPPSVVTGAQSSDQIVLLLALQFPQVHTLSYFNLAAGIVYSTVRSRTFGVPPGIPATKTISTDDQYETGSSASIEPVLMLTIYPWPIDAETKCGLDCIVKAFPPGVSVGLSLTNPSTSFYWGLSFEVVRNIQFVVGLNTAKQAGLPDPPANIPGNTTTAVTVQRFTTKPFYGLTFNVSGFVQGLFGGGGSGGGSKGSAATQTSP